nr:hypothetical protein [uncultured Moraxella sp.]
MDFFEDGIDVALRMGELHTDTVISKPVGVVKTLFVASPQLFEKPFENFEKPNNIKQLF